jgi:predicted kinase
VIVIKNDKPIIYVAIGPSGSGKSTIYKKFKLANPNLNYFSWDRLRLDWYDSNNYDNAWKLANDDKSFGLKADIEFRDLLKQHQDIFVDNTNLSIKRRKSFIVPAKKLGYKTVAVVFDVPLNTLIARQLTRGDKYVPAEAVTRQFQSMQHPNGGEFDEVLKANEIV